MSEMRSPLLVHISAAEPGKGQTDRWHGLTTMRAEEPDNLDDDEDDDDFEDDEDDGKRDGDDDEDDEEDEEDDEPETWQVECKVGSSVTPQWVVYPVASGSVGTAAKKRAAVRSRVR